MLHYLLGDKLDFSPGKILNIDKIKSKIEHSCSTEMGSSGGPLLNFLNHKIIGIHKGSKKDYNLATLIKKELNTPKHTIIYHYKYELNIFAFHHHPITLCNIAECISHKISITDIHNTFIPTVHHDRKFIVLWAFLPYPVSFPQWAFDSLTVQEMPPCVFPGKVFCFCRFHSNTSSLIFSIISINNTVSKYPPIGIPLFKSSYFCKKSCSYYCPKFLITHFLPSSLKSHNTTLYFLCLKSLKNFFKVL